MHRRIGHLIASDQLVLGVRIHVVLVAKKALAMLLRPAGVAVLLAQLGGLLLPVRRRPTGLHGFVLVTAIALFRHRHNRGINHLPATRHVALRRNDRLDVGTKALPRHQSIDGFERITLRRQRRQPLLSVEEPELTHLRLPNHAVANETRTTQSEWPFFEAPLSRIRSSRRSGVGALIEERKQLSSTDFVLMGRNLVDTDSLSAILRAPVVRAYVILERWEDRKSTRLNSSHRCISYAVFC